MRKVKDAHNIAEKSVNFNVNKFLVKLNKLLEEEAVQPNKRIHDLI